MKEPVDKNQENTIEEAVRQFVDDMWQGRKPDIEEFVKQYPQFEYQIRQRIQDVQKIDTLFDSLVHADESDFENPGTAQNLVGQKIGSFEIVKVIGSGGMGVVYLAHDTRLKRSVAIKSIPAQLKDDSTARMRFKREAELLASLNHTGIAVIYDIIAQDDGTGYLVLEYVPGETLAERIARGPLDLEETLSIACQIAEAVSAAHKKGIIHRDLKPGNIKLTPENRVKVLDFGLAKVSTKEGKDIEITSTEPGHIIGTPAYMSPEQARGTEIDHRTDIWAFGCTLYQMLTGSIPFGGQTATDTLAHIIERQPDWNNLPKKTPENIRILLRRCLEKNPDQRLEDIAEAVIEISETLSKPLIAPASMLRKIAMILSAVAVCIILFLIASKFIPQKVIQSFPKKIRLVVLPFENLGPSDDEWFADGMTDEITSRLAGIHGLGVISRQSAIQYKKREKSTSQIAKDLSVDYILEGTIQREQPSDPNSRIRIRCQLIRAADDTHIWSNNYDNDMREIFRLQSKVAEQVAQGLDITLIEPEGRALSSLPTDNVEAYTFYLQGNEYFHQGLNSKDDYEIAINMYDNAIELDPKFALAYTQLSMAHSQMYWFYCDRSEARLVLAKYNVDRALQINPDLPEAHRALGFYYYWGYLDYNSALEQFAIAQKNLPNNSTLLSGIAYVLRRKGNLEKAAVTLEKALELSPRDIGLILNLGETFRHLRKHQQAEHYYDIAILLFPDRPGAYDHKAWFYMITEGNSEKARAFLRMSQTNFKSVENPFINTLVKLDVFDGRYQEALDLLSLKSDDVDTLERYIPIALRYAQIYRYMEEEDLSRKYYNESRIILESKIKENPEDERLHSSLGITYAGLGRKEDAIQHGKLSVELLPVSKDAMRGPFRIEVLALIYVMVGEFDEAIDKLEYLLKIPGQLSIPLLKIDPAWKPLRNHPRFKKLIESGK